MRMGEEAVMIMDTKQLACRCCYIPDGRLLLLSAAVGTLWLVPNCTV